MYIITCFIIFLGYVWFLENLRENKQRGKVEVKENKK